MDFTDKAFCGAKGNKTLELLCLCGVFPCKQTGKAQTECAKKKLRNVLKKGN